MHTPPNLSVDRVELVPTPPGPTAVPPAAAGLPTARIGVTGESPPRRSSTPRTAEQGVDGFQVFAWNGLYAPRGTPSTIVQRLNAELNRILSHPEVRQRLLELGHEPVGGPPSELGDFARSERQKWGPLIAKAGMRAE